MNELQSLREYILEKAESYSSADLNLISARRISNLLLHFSEAEYAMTPVEDELMSQKHQDTSRRIHDFHDKTKTIALSKLYPNNIKKMIKILRPYKALSDKYRLNPYSTGKVIGGALGGPLVHDALVGAAYKKFINKRSATEAKMVYRIDSVLKTLLKLFKAKR